LQLASGSYLQRHFGWPDSLSFAAEANKRPMTTTMTTSKTSISSRKKERKKGSWRGDQTGKLEKRRGNVIKPQ